MTSARSRRRLFARRYVASIVLPGICCGAPSAAQDGCRPNVSHIAFDFTGDDCSATEHDQSPGSVVCTDLGRIPRVVDISIDGQFFESIALGDNFRFVGSPGPEIQADILTVDGQLVQVVRFQSNCCEPLAGGDQFGSLLVRFSESGGLCDIGACCFCDAACDVLEETDCLALDGDYQGNESTCEQAGCQPYAPCPEGCLSGGVRLFIQPLLDGVPPIDGVVCAGDQVLLRVTLGQVLPNGCDYFGGQLSATFPDGLVVQIAGFARTPEVPVIGFGEPFVVDAPVHYTVDPADSLGGTLLVQGDYGPTPGQPDQTPGLFLSEPPALATATTIAAALSLFSLPADVNHDGIVDVLDLIALITAWGPCEGCPADLDGDGVVAVLDLIELLLAWGESCRG